MNSAETNLRLQRLHADLHDLCQPLTALQCRLEIGKMMGQEKALREAVEGALVETQRMFAAIARVRESLRRTEEAGS